MIYINTLFCAFFYRNVSEIKMKIGKIIEKLKLTHFFLHCLMDTLELYTYCMCNGQNLQLSTLEIWFCFVSKQFSPPLT